MLRKFLIRVNGNEYEVEMEELTAENEQPAVPQPAPQAATVQAASTSVAAESEKPMASVQTGASLLAPMPGTILKIMVETGQPVKENQPLLILEAMKMENEIVADRSGTIAAIQVQKGDVVNPGQPLLEIG